MTASKGIRRPPLPQWRREGEREAKTCPRCGHFQIIEAFPLHETARDGPVRAAWCRECFRDKLERWKARQRATA